MNSTVRRITLAATSAGALVLGMMATGTAASAAPTPAATPRAAAVSCTTGSTTVVAGGYLITMSCGGKTVTGVGSTQAEARANGHQFGELAAQSGQGCTTTSTSVQATVGGWLVRFSCGAKTVSGLGSTFTGVGVNALALAQAGAASGYYCNLAMSNLQGFVGGWTARFSCGTKTVSGMGSTLTDVGANVAGFVQYGAASNRWCTFHTSTLQGTVGGWLARFDCGTKSVSGAGSTMTDVAANALGFAQHSLVSDRFCTLHLSDVRAVGGGWVFTFSCDGRRISGAGSTMTDAGRNALGFADVSTVNGRYCTLDVNYIWAYPGGYQAQFFCSNRSVTGQGPTVTAAAENARLIAMSL